MRRGGGKEIHALGSFTKGRAGKRKRGVLSKIILVVVKYIRAVWLDVHQSHLKKS